MDGGRQVENSAGNFEILWLQACFKILVRIHKLKLGIGTGTGIGISISSGYSTSEGLAQV